MKRTISNPLRATNVLRNTLIPNALTPNGDLIKNRAFLRSLLVAVAAFGDHETGENARPALDTLAEVVQASRRTVQRGLDRLEGLGLLRKTLSHCWKLHRPTTWAVVPAVLRAARVKAILVMKGRAARYWATDRPISTAPPGRRFGSGGHHDIQPSPLQGERREARPPGGGGMSILDVLAGLQAI